jgi:hypothetical protein
MVTYTTTDLIEAIKRTAHVPTANETFQDPGLLALADTEMRTFVAPKVAAVRENYWTKTKDYDVDEASEVNTFEMPSLAIGGGIIEAKLLQSDFYLPLDRIEISELIGTQFSPRPIYGYTIEDNLIKLLPNGGISGTLRVWYQRIPSKLVATSACAEITAVNGNTVTVASLPASMTTETELDIVSAQPGFNCIKIDSAPTAINNMDLTFDELPAGRVKVGDWVCLSGESCVVQAPLEWIEVLVQAVAVKIFLIQGYLTKKKDAEVTLTEMAKAATSTVSPRQTEKTKFINGGGSVLNAGAGNWRYLVGRRQ